MPHPPSPPYDAYCPHRKKGADIIEIFFHISDVGSITLSEKTKRRVLDAIKRIRAEVVLTRGTQDLTESTLCMIADYFDVVQAGADQKFQFQLGVGDDCVAFCQLGLNFLLSLPNTFVKEYMDPIHHPENRRVFLRNDLLVAMTEELSQNDISFFHDPNTRKK